MMDVLQWAGMVCIVLAYLFYVKDPWSAALITILGCVAVLAWAMLLTPVAWGIVALEGTVIGISLRNLWIIRA
jgi:hypothetical protein